MFDFFRCVAVAVREKGLRGLAGIVPLGETLYDIAADSIKRWRDRKKEEKQQEKVRQEFEKAAQMKLDEFENAMRQIALEVMPDQPPNVREALTQYLSLIPERIRQTFSRADDPSGKTVPVAWLLQEPEDVIPLLPTRLPQFKPSDLLPNNPKWELIKRLGIGGFGEVWLGRHKETHHEAAFKIFLDPQTQKLLKHEASIARRVQAEIKHPGIIKLEDLDFTAEWPWLQYEYVPDGDLTVQKWPSDSGRRVKLATDTILALSKIAGFCHGLTPPIVHRDLKPTNILARKNPDGRFQLKIIDFGISAVVAAQIIGEAKRATYSAASLRTPTLVRCAFTPLYASPQQQAGMPSDPRDDVHALGVLWYQLLLNRFNVAAPRGRMWKQQLAELGTSAAAIDLLEACCDQEAVGRPLNCQVMVSELECLEKKGTETLPVPLFDEKPFKSMSELESQGKEELDRWAEETARQFGANEKRPPDLLVAPFSEQKAKEAQIAWATHLGHKVVEEFDLGQGIKLSMALIPPGTFLMGSPESEPERRDDEKLHEVTLTQPFYMGVHQVTQEHWQAVMGDNPSRFKGTKNLPVERVSWEECIDFCKKLSERIKQVFKLPTEAQWEYACRSGTTTPFAFGETITTSNANYNGNSTYSLVKNGDRPKQTTPAGMFGSNHWGLYDMHGNVREWCLDWYAKETFNLTKCTDPSGPENGVFRVNRGGCWYFGQGHCRSAFRYAASPVTLYYDVGFRLISFPSAM